MTSYDKICKLKKKNTNKNSNKKYSFLNIILSIDFDSPHCENEFMVKMNDVKMNNYFFDIYNFVGLNMESDIDTVKSKYIELKNEIINNVESNDIFLIFLNIIGLNKTKSINSTYSKVQLKIIDIVCKILSNHKLKNIYDKYYLDQCIEIVYTQTNNTNVMKKTDIIEKVYYNLFIEPKISDKMMDINDTNYLNDLYELRLLEYSFQKDEKTPEELDLIYNNMNEIKNTTRKNYFSKTMNDLIRNQFRQISNPPIDYTIMNFLNEIMIKNDIDATDSNNLINYCSWKNINRQKYYPIDSVGIESFLADSFTKQKLTDFSIDDFTQWKKLNDYSDRPIELEYDKIIETRKKQEYDIANDINNKLYYYAGRKFTLEQIKNECNYSNAFNKNI